MTPERCLNCEEPIRSSLEFCPSCGQKNIGSKITISQVFSDFIDNFFNLDNRLLVSLKHLAVPGKLTKAYFAGKRIKYLNPLRLFLLCALFCFGMTRLMISSNQGEGMSQSWFDRSTSRAMTTVMDSLHSYHEDISRHYPSSKKALDSLKNKMHLKFHGKTDSIRFGNAHIGTLELKDLKIAQDDAFNLSHKDLCAKYLEHHKIEGRFNRFLFSQLLRNMETSLAGYVNSLLSNLVWMMLVALPFIAFFMKILYVRRKRFFVEHLIFQVHGHCFLMLSIGAILVFTYFESFIPIGLFATGVSFISTGIVIYYIWAMKAYYQQGLIRTLIKAWLLWTVYLSIIIFFLLITSLLTAIIQ